MNQAVKQEAEYRKKYYSVEKTLHNLYGLKMSIKIMQKSIEEIEGGDIWINAVDTTRESRKTNRVDSITESNAICIYDKCTRIKNKINQNKRIIEIYEEALGVLQEVERKIIEMRYFEGCQWWEIAASVHMSERNAKYKRKNAINKMIIVLDEVGEFCTNFALQIS